MSDPVTGALAAGGVLSSLGGLAAAGVSAWNNWQNIAFQQQANAQNLAFQREANSANIALVDRTNAQNLALTQGAWARDDSAIQRRVADLNAAGLNPVLAAGSGAGNTGPIPMRSADVQPGQVRAPQVGENPVTQGIIAANAMTDLRAKQASIAQTEAQTRLTNAHADVAAGTSASDIEAQKTKNQILIDTAGNAVSLIASTATRSKLEGALLDLKVQLQGYLQGFTFTGVGGEMNSQIGDSIAAQMARIELQAKEKGVDHLSAQIAAMAYAVQAAGMDAEAARRLGIPPKFLDFLGQVARGVATAGGIAAVASLF